MTAPKAGFAPVNGLDLYYEIHGTGAPLLMLHGGIGAHEQFGPNLEELAKTRQVIIAHMQGHGHTRDIDRPFAYPQFADDAAALLDYLRYDKVDVLGYSLGANIALRLAIQHPDKVHRLIPVSGNLAPDGQYPEVVAAFPPMVEQAAEMGKGLADSPMAEMYPEVNWENSFRKTGELEQAGWDWSEEAKGIAAPTLLIFADADSIRAEHIVAMYRILGGFARDAGWDGSLRPTGQLAVLPGRTHYNIFETTDIARLVETFLTNAS